MIGWTLIRGRWDDPQRGLYCSYTSTYTHMKTMQRIIGNKTIYIIISAERVEMNNQEIYSCGLCTPRVYL